MRRRAFVFSAILGLAGAASAAPKPIVFWHDQDAEQARFLVKLVDEYNRALPAGEPRVRAETGLDLSTAMLARLGKADEAEIVLAPSDLIGMRTQLKLSPVTDLNAGVLPVFTKTIVADGKPLGAPVLGGNHLVVLYDRTKLPTPPTDWENSPAGTSWTLSEPYYLIPFLAAAGGWPVKGDKSALEQASLEAALGLYGTLVGSKKIDRACVEKPCGPDDLSDGKAVLTIGGEWEYNKAHAKLGERLGVSPLLPWKGRAMKSVVATHALIFPDRSLSRPRAASLRKFAAFLQSRAVQERWMREMKRVPVIDIPLEGGPAFKTLATIAREGRPLEPSRALPYVWLSMRRGIKLFFSGTSAPEASRYIVSETKRLMGAK